VVGLQHEETRWVGVVGLWGAAEDEGAGGTDLLGCLHARTFVHDLPQVCVLPCATPAGYVRAHFCPGGLSGHGDSTPKLSVRVFVCECVRVCVKGMLLSSHFFECNAAT
jgi:hypothetical protein